MQTAFLEAVVNRRHTVLLRELHDFCLYDILALTISANPLWVGGRASIDDLRAAVLICSLPAERFLRAEMDPRDDAERAERAAWLLVTEPARHDPEIFARELAAWDAYQADFCALPALTDPDGQGRTLNAPWVLRLAVYLEMHTNMSEAEIMSAPYGKMEWKAATVAERRGETLCELLTQDDLDLLRERAQLEATAEAPE